MHFIYCLKLYTYVNKTENWVAEDNLKILEKIEVCRKQPRPKEMPFLDPESLW